MRRLGIPTQNTSDVGVGESQNFAKRMEKGKSILVRRDDRRVASANEAKVNDRGRRLVPFRAALEH
jgi:hypothetical protein